MAGVVLAQHACGTGETTDAAGATAAPSSSLSVTSPAEATTTSAPKPTRTSRTPDAPLRTVCTFVDNGSAPAQPGS
ncbi:hypothetical protein AB0G15_37970 [Streptosporangium sp. NPDC023825]|uniref:hypothetical protein n=1 Tax=Streptosporangium sp. NPDC023825 TaxID=3154909 RepID=UPI00343DB106